MRFGYARVSTADQSLTMQLAELEKADCDEILSETASGAAGARPELSRLLDKLRPGDEVVVWRLDRLGRSLKHLVGLVEELVAREVHLVSLTEKLDTGSANGKMLLHLFALMAEFERNLISERTRSGLEVARARGRKGGRPKALTDKQIKLAKAMLQDPAVTKKEVAEQLGVSVSTLYRHV